MALVRGATLIVAIAATASVGQAQEAAHTSSSLRAYQSRVANIMGAAWYREVVRRHYQLSEGTVRVTFYILPSGEPRDIRIAAKPHDRASADLLRGVLRKITFPRIPARVLRQLPEGRIDVVFNFKLYPPTATNSSNQSLEPTAGRSDAHI